MLQKTKKLKQEGFETLAILIDSYEILFDSLTSYNKKIEELESEIKKGREELNGENFSE